MNPDDAVAAQGDFLGIDDDFRLFQQIFCAAVNHHRVACRVETPYAAFILGEEVISLLNVRIRIVGFDVIKVVVGQLLFNAEIVISRKARRLGRKILQKGCNLIIRTALRNVIVVQCFHPD